MDACDGEDGDVGDGLNYNLEYWTSQDKQDETLEFTYKQGQACVACAQTSRAGHVWHVLTAHLCAVPLPPGGGHCWTVQCQCASRDQGQESCQGFCMEVGSRWNSL